MSSQPYRLAQLSPPREEPSPGNDAEILPAMLLLWAAAAGRVAWALAQHERFGAEGSLALLVVLALPWLVWPRRPAPGA